MKEYSFKNQNYHIETNAKLSCGFEIILHNKDLILILKIWK